MDVWRLTRPEFAPDLDGIGARRAGGRWNSPGRPAVYCASSLALAALEVFVHLPPSMRTAEKLPHLLAIKLRIPDGVSSQKAVLKNLPETPKISDYRTVGDVWLQDCKTLVLSVESMVVPYEKNYVLNPAHKEMAKVKVVDTLTFEFDPRLAR